MTESSTQSDRAAALPLPLTGGCRCGAIRYAITAPPLRAVTCHCRDCQYASGGAPAHGLVLQADGLSIARGKPRAYEFRAASGRAVFRSFCPDCGTPLFGGSAGLDFVSVKVGTLDHPGLFRSEMEIWTSSAPSWHHVDPDIPQFPQTPAPAAGDRR